MPTARTEVTQINEAHRRQQNMAAEAQGMATATGVVYFVCSTYGRGLYITSQPTSEDIAQNVCYVANPREGNKDGI